MRNLIAGYLRDQSAGRYTVAQENELANAQRPDIFVQARGVANPLPVELKLLDKGWTGPSLVERLRNQLGGDYLREGQGRCGIFLLVRAGGVDRRWEIGEGQVGLAELGAALQREWDATAAGSPHVDQIMVVTINLQLRGPTSADV